MCVVNARCECASGGSERTRGGLPPKAAVSAGSRRIANTDELRKWAPHCVGIVRWRDMNVPSFLDDNVEDELTDILKRAYARMSSSCKQNLNNQFHDTDECGECEEDDEDGGSKHAFVESETYKKGFVSKKRVLDFSPKWRSANMLDFIIENPLDGKLKELPFVMQLVRDYPNTVRQVGTSYCHYGYSYRKKTVFISTLMELELTAPCPKHPCCLVQQTGKHPARSSECGQEQKNSLPPLLVDAVLQVWTDRHSGRASRFLVIDVFAGWNSVKKRVQEHWSNVYVYSNDIVLRRGTDIDLDMSAASPFTPGSLLLFALSKLWPNDYSQAVAHEGGVVGWLQENKVAVLFHSSTPCRTYSTQALSVHRFKGSARPKSLDALHDDAMNEKLVDYFKRHILYTPRGAC